MSMKDIWRYMFGHDAPMGQPRSTSTKSANLPSNTWVEVRKTAHAGLGLFAIRDIPRGTRIVEEPDLLVICDENDLLELHRALRCLDKQQSSIFFSLYAEMRAGVGRDSSTESIGGRSQHQWARKLFVELIRNQPNRQSIHTALAEQCVDELIRAHAILITNSFTIDATEDEDGHSAVFGPLTSRINHACVPNVNQSYNKIKSAMTTHTLQDIAAGQELFTNYAGYQWIDKSAVARKLYLKELWGFDCKCCSCDLSNWESDERRSLLKTRRERLERYEATPAGEKISKRMLDWTLDSLSLLQQEGFIGRDLSDLRMQAVTLYMEMGDLVRAENHARALLALERVCVGSDGTEYIAAKRLLDEFPGLMLRLTHARKEGIVGSMYPRELRESIDRCFACDVSLSPSSSERIKH